MTVTARTHPLVMYTLPGHAVNALTKHLAMKGKAIVEDMDLHEDRRLAMMVGVLFACGLRWNEIRGSIGVTTYRVSQLTDWFIGLWQSSGALRHDYDRAMLVLKHEAQEWIAAREIKIKYKGGDGN